jgi:hypothetical protein
MKLTVAEIALYLGMTPSGVRTVISKHKIPSAGTRWKAKLYWPDDVLRHTGTEDRQVVAR